jgi:hypothetical protein
MNKEYELKLRKEFLDAYRIAQKEYKFKSPIFIRMLNEHGALETAKRLTNTSRWQPGYEKLAFLGRTDLTVEHIILQDMYSSYFTDAQLSNARIKLEVAKKTEGHRY